VLSRDQVLAHFQSEYWISAYMMSGSSFGVFLSNFNSSSQFSSSVFMLHAFCALCLLVGYRTNLFSFLTFFFTISVQDRLYVLLHGGDVLQRVTHFFALFLPLGDVCSVDQALKKKKPNHNNRYQVFSVGALALILQVLTMYWMAHKLKTGAEWRVHYTVTLLEII
jgi:hypothetical protein